MLCYILATIYQLTCHTSGAIACCLLERFVLYSRYIYAAMSLNDTYTHKMQHILVWISDREMQVLLFDNR